MSLLVHHLYWIVLRIILYWWIKD